MSEVWKVIPDCPDYDVSDMGNARSRRLSGAPVLLKLQKRRNGYLGITIWRADGTARQAAIHHLVLEAFVGPRPKGYVSRHLNDVRDDNRLANLAWGTYAENAADAIRNGRHWSTNKTHCAKGHEFTEENTLRHTRNGVVYRTCRTCVAAHNKIAHDRRAVENARLRAESGKLPFATHCVKGHERTPENTYINTYGRRLCRICLKATQERHWAKQRQAKITP